MQRLGLDELEARVTEQTGVLEAIRSEVAKVVVGQRYMVDRLLIGLLANGHLLLEGVPGLAKTTAVKTLASALSTGFARIQFTPDLLPADLLGTQIYSPHTGEFSTRKGPIFSNLVLADEINRAPAKVQSALLESMQERQVTIGDESFALPAPFLVLATQNPIEQEGTYPLPEAQVDRFMMKLRVGYPSREEEREVMRRSAAAAPTLDTVCSAEQIVGLQQLCRDLMMEDVVGGYIVDLVRATREPETLGLELGRYIQFGASPRASIALAAAGRAHALLDGRAFVTPDDIKAIGPDVLRHRVLLSYEAEAEELDSDQVLEQIFGRVKTPEEPRMLTAEELRQIRRLTVQAGRRVDSLFAGGYRSAFKGRGMEFEEVRLYVPGDDVRHIDWNVTARAQSPHIKEFREERELTLMLAIDVSASMSFGSGGKDGLTDKRRQLARVAGALAYAAIRNNDRVGMLAFTDHIEHFVPPRKSRGHAWRVIREVYDHHPVARRTDLAGALDYLGRVLRRRAVICVVSDFLSDTPWERRLAALAARHTVHAFVVHDPLEAAVPAVGLIELEDAETGRRRLVDARAVRPGQPVQDRLQALRRSGARPSVIATDRDPFLELMAHFHRVGGRR